MRRGEPTHGTWAEASGEPCVPGPATTVVRRTSATGRLCSRSVSPCSTIPSPQVRQRTLDRPRREADSAYGTGSAYRLQARLDTNLTARPPLVGAKAGEHVSPTARHTVRRFAMPLQERSFGWLDRFLGIGWTGEKTSRFTCGCITFLGILHYPDQVLGSGPHWVPSQPACASSPNQLQL